MYISLVFGLASIANNTAVEYATRQAQLIACGVSFAIAFAIIHIIAATIILTTDTKTKWKAFLLISWLVFTPIYIVLYFVKFKSIFPNVDLTKNQTKNIYNNSIISFFVLIALIGLAVANFTVKYVPNESPVYLKIVDSIIGVLYLIAVNGYLWTFMMSLYLSLFVENHKISYIQRTPLLFSFVWMYSNKLLAAKASNSNK